MFASSIMHFAWSTSLLQQPQVCLPRPSFAQTPIVFSQATPPSLPTPPPPVSAQEEDKIHLESYSIFPQCSVNLITCSSNSGKTRFLHQVILHRHRFFQNSDSIKRIIYVNGNQRDLTIQHPWSGDNDQASTLEFVSLALDEFKDCASVLQSNDLLVLDDILQVNETVQFIVKYGAHHFQLASVFVVTQSCLGSPLYSLIGSVHNLVLLFGNSATTRLAQHLNQSFFLCTDTKAYLKSIFGQAEKNQSTLILKLNAVASYRPHSHILALTDVQRLFDSYTPYCWVYPELGHTEDMERKMANYQAEMPTAALGERLNEAFVLLPASQVKKIPEATTSQDDCLKDEEQKWNDMTRFLEMEIESTFPFKKWNVAKNLARELLRCNELCISLDYRTVFIREKPKLAFSIVDFLMAATRKAGPGETVHKVSVYRPLVQVLLRHHVPHTFIVNKLMLPSMRSSIKPRRRLSGYQKQKESDEEDYLY